MNKKYKSSKTKSLQKGNSSPSQNLHKQCHPLPRLGKQETLPLNSPSEISAPPPPPTRPDEATTHTSYGEAWEGGRAGVRFQRERPRGEPSGHEERAKVSPRPKWREASGLTGHAPRSGRASRRASHHRRGLAALKIQEPSPDRTRTFRARPPCRTRSEHRCTCLGAGAMNGIHLTVIVRSTRVPAPGPLRVPRLPTSKDTILTFRRLLAPGICERGHLISVCAHTHTHTRIYIHLKAADLKWGDRPVMVAGFGTSSSVVFFYMYVIFHN